jgi:hypothetical protein
MNEEKKDKNLVKNESSMNPHNSNEIEAIIELLKNGLIV